MKKEKKEQNKIMAVSTIAIGALALFTPEVASAALTAAQSLGGVATNVQGSLAPIMSLITGGSYVAGAAFGASSLMGFKQHAENPQQVPLKQPFVKMGVAAGLSYLGYFLGSGGATMFGTSATSGSVAGFN